MTTVIIGGGEKARNAVTQLETASLSMSQTDRDAAEAFFDGFAACIKARCEDNTPLPELVAP